MQYLLSMLPLHKFALAGNATFTVSNIATGNRFTFRVRKPKNGAANCPHFVSVLTGADNENSYSYLGCIFSDGNFRRTAKSKIGAEAPSHKAFEWVWSNRMNEEKLGRVEIRHAGKCCRCGRKLTVPSSIDSGVGPECAGML